MHSKTNNQIDKRRMRLSLAMHNRSPRKVSSDFHFGVPQCETRFYRNQPRGTQHSERVKDIVKMHVCHDMVVCGCSATRKREFIVTETR